MAYQPWFNPDLQSIAGLNSAMVFGENIQFATGVNHQIALGSNMQLCVNPGTWFSMIGGPACSALNDFFGAGGLGGNLQFTIGTNTTVNWGASVSGECRGRNHHHRGCSARHDRESFVRDHWRPDDRLCVGVWTLPGRELAGDYHHSVSDCDGCNVDYLHDLST